MYSPLGELSGEGIPENRARSRFAIDEKLAANDECYDGLFVLRTDTDHERLHPDAGRSGLGIEELNEDLICAKIHRDFPPA